MVSVVWCDVLWSVCAWGVGCMCLSWFLCVYMMHVLCLCVLSVCGTVCMCVVGMVWYVCVCVPHRFPLIIVCE